MRTKQIRVYRFAELSDEAKERAKQEYASACGYSWSTEALDSLKALARHFGGELSDWSIDWFGGPSSASFDMPEMDRDEIAAELAKLGEYNPETLKGIGDCKLTGYCADESAIDGFRVAFVAGESDLVALMDAAFDAWIKDAQSDCKWQFSDEAFGEHCDANGYEFDERGELI